MSRSVVQALNEEVAGGRLGRTDHVLLHDSPAQPPPRPLLGDRYLANGSNVRFALQIWRKLLRHRYDLVLFDHIGLARSMAILPPGLHLPPFSCFIYGLELQGANERKRQRAIDFSHRLLAISAHTSQLLNDVSPSALDRVEIVPLCLDPERIATWQRLKESSAAEPRQPVALIVGRMDSGERGKGHDSVIEAWPSVRQAVPDAELWVVGAGDDVDRLRLKAGRLRQSGAITFLGRVPDRELSKLYRTVSVFVMPSRQEGFGLVYTEAMWHELACIGSRSDAAGEVILDGETGLLVPYGDPTAIAEAVITLLTDPELSRAMGQAGHMRVQTEFTYERFKHSLLTALEMKPQTNMH